QGRRMRGVYSGVDAAHRSRRQSDGGHVRVLERKQCAGFAGAASAAAREHHADLARIASKRMLAALPKAGAESFARLSQLPLELRIIHSPGLGGCGGSIIRACGGGNRRMAASRLRMTY